MQYNKDYERALQYSKDELASNDVIAHTTSAARAALGYDNLPHQVLADAMEEHGHPAFQHLAELLRESDHNGALKDCPWRVHGHKPMGIYKDSTLPTISFQDSEVPKSQLLKIVIPEPHPSIRSLNLEIRKSLPEIKEHLTKLKGFNNVEDSLGLVNAQLPAYIRSQQWPEDQD